ncbi:hypothetical protein LRM42_00820 [Candidatus Nanosynbacter sp. TM7-075]|uniref:hypothetical protein n=1 Tax=Candidatus Nanosynbacter sp. TM7-075 TaxID=2902633 RepID=UPI001FB7E996|nr:hypothetical protein [Candidatus Nanosynbacter sp. TM7-075]MCJ1966856.1 hypothetical protein [Candidatus Nanosynbacter sp. TM7-075]
MNERPTVRVAVLERMEDVTLADLPEGKTILLSGKPTEANNTTFNDKVPVIEKWTDEDGRTRILGRYATIMYDANTQELSLALPDQEITRLRRSDTEDQNYIAFTTEDPDKE